MEIEKKRITSLLQWRKENSCTLHPNKCEKCSSCIYFEDCCYFKKERKQIYHFEQKRRTIGKNRGFANKQRNYLLPVQNSEEGFCTPEEEFECLIKVCKEGQECPWYGG